MIKLGTCIPGDAVRRSDGTYFTMNGILSERQFVDLQNRCLRESRNKAAEKEVALKNIKRTAEKMLITGYDEDYVKDFIKEQMDIEGIGSDSG